MNSMPAASNARRIARSFAAVNDVWCSVNSARRIVVTARAEARARSSAVQRIRARPARICPLVREMRIGVDVSILYDIFHPMLDAQSHHEPRERYPERDNRGLAFGGTHEYGDNVKT